MRLKLEKSDRRSFQRFVRRLDSTGLRKGLEARLRKRNITLRDLYEGPNKAPSIADARFAVYTWLARERGKGINEIARLFDRAPSGVHKMINREGR